MPHTTRKRVQCLHFCFPLVGRPSPPPAEMTALAGSSLRQGALGGPPQQSRRLRLPAASGFPAGHAVVLVLFLQAPRSPVRKARPRPVLRAAPPFSPPGACVSAGRMRDLSRMSKKEAAGKARPAARLTPNGQAEGRSAFRRNRRRKRLFQLLEPCRRESESASCPPCLPGQELLHRPPFQSLLSGAGRPAARLRGRRPDFVRHELQRHAVLADSFQAQLRSIHLLRQERRRPGMD